MDSEQFDQLSDYAKKVFEQVRTGEGSLNRATILEDIRDSKLDYKEAFLLLYELDKRKEEQRTKDFRSGVFNAEFFEKIFPIECGRSIRMQYELSMILIDLDDFRRFNNEYNYLIGNKIIHDVAQTIRKSVRRTDIVCRYAGEEFVVLCPSSDANQTVKVAEKIRLAVANMDVQCMGNKEMVTISSGVSQFKREVADVKDIKGLDKESHVLIEKATEALHKAKQACKNKVEIA